MICCLDSPLFLDVHSPSINVRSVMKGKVEASLDEAHGGRLKRVEWQHLASGLAVDGVLRQG